MNNRTQDVANLKKLSELLDSKFTGPMGIRFGLDGLLGLIPVVGDFITTSASFYIIWHAAQMGCSTSTLLRMGLNIIFENLVDMIPVVGHFFDFYWKANNKNIILLQRHLENPSSLKRQSWLVIFTIFLALVSLLIFSGFITFWLIKAIVGLF